MFSLVLELSISMIVMLINKKKEIVSNILKWKRTFGENFSYDAYHLYHYSRNEMKITASFEGFRERHFDCYEPT